MRKYLLFCAVTACASLIADATNQPSSSASGYSGYSSPFRGISDQTLQGQIENTLSAYRNQGKYDNVTAVVTNGNAILKGTVVTQEDKDALGGLVGSINGILSVDNKVTVDPSSATSEQPTPTTTSKTGKCSY